MAGMPKRRKPKRTQAQYLADLDAVIRSARRDGVPQWEIEALLRKRFERISVGKKRRYRDPAGFLGPGGRRANVTAGDVYGRGRLP
jgi:hypothetical protein